jgi:lipoprotein-anchoring transpeptidase ErfK/SrfK
MENRETTGQKKTIKVLLTQQVVEGYEGEKCVFRLDCVSGDEDHPTPTGSFSILRKHAIYKSHTYKVQMNYSMFFTTTGEVLHQYHGPVPFGLMRLGRKVSGWVGSHGCVRLSEENAKMLFNWTPMKTPVYVV